MARFENGWIKVHRKAVEEDIGQRGNFTLGLFVRLLRMANWRPGSAPFAGQRIELKPGQLITGLRELSPDVEEDPYLHRVRTALAYLEKRGTITQAVSNHGRLITIQNWDAYYPPVDDASGESASKAQADRKQSASRPQLIEEGRKKKKSLSAKGAIEELQDDVLNSLLASVTQKLQRSWIEEYKNVEWIKRELKKANEWALRKGREIESPSAFFGNWLRRGEPPVQPVAKNATEADLDALDAEFNGEVTSA